MPDKEPPKLGLDPATTGDTIEGLSALLADTYVLYVLTQGFHWNVTGPDFPQLHAMFEEQYIDLREAADEIAERIRALGATSPGTLTEFLAKANLKETPAPTAKDMVEVLVDGHETIAREHRALVATADDAADVATSGLVADRITVHEKTAWMLRATAS